MNLKIDKKLFLSKFLTPVSRITDSCILTLNKDGVHTLTNTDDNGIILYAKLDTAIDIDEEVNLNISSLKKLNHALNCINETTLDLTINSNSINYTSDTLKFKFHLMEDGILTKCYANPEKIKLVSDDANNTFYFTRDKLLEILKGNAFANETDKIYFYTEDDKVYGELTDKKYQNVNSLTFEVTDKYTGDDLLTPLPINLEVLRVFSSLKLDKTKAKVNTDKKVFIFEIKDTNFSLIYTVPTISK
jgi:hypothetical protein